MSLEENWPFLSPYALDSILSLTNGDEDSSRVCVLAIEFELRTRFSGDSVYRSLYLLDALHVHDADIYLLYKEVCHENIKHMIALLNATYSGFVTQKALQHAIAHHGEGIDLNFVLNTNWWSSLGFSSSDVPSSA